MPELPEVEAYRELAATVVGRRVTAVRALDPWYVKGEPVDALVAALSGRTVTAARRRGKLLVLDTDGPDRLGVRFGMTGTLAVDGHLALERLRYAPAEPDARWVRFELGFAGGGTMAVHDPRRLGGVCLDPDESALGPDAATVGTAALGAALAGSAAPLKARLLDQARLAGVGNLVADEVLWRAGLAPDRPAGSLDRTEVARLQRALVAGIADLCRRGGSDAGDLFDHRRPGGRCPRDGTALVRATIGGRTTWWCPSHQR
ncbi:MAG: formamidopyrimidine-DNA glycosylase [Actinomycetota bacterium]|nr:formamidopyrimidine-DNA glycosylase [Actinomycetota bacterium]